MFRPILVSLKQATLIIAVLSTSALNLSADEPANDQAPSQAKAPRTVIEQDPETGVSRLFVIEPDGEKRLLQTFPDGLPLNARPIPPVVADYFDAVNSIALSDRYVLGVELKTIPKGLHARLGIDSDSGLIVANLLPDKPAALAGVQQYDILLKVNGQAVSQPGDVVRMVNKSKGQPVTLTLLRDKEPFELKVTPVKFEFEAPSADALPPGLPGTAIPRGALPPGVQIVGPGMVVPSSRDAEIQMLKAELAEVREQMQLLSEQVQQLQKSLKQE